MLLGLALQSQRQSELLSPISLLPFHPGTWSPSSRPWFPGSLQFGMSKQLNSGQWMWMEVICMTFGYLWKEGVCFPLPLVSFLWWYETRSWNGSHKERVAEWQGRRLVPISLCAYMLTWQRNWFYSFKLQLFAFYKSSQISTPNI